MCICVCVSEGVCCSRDAHVGMCVCVCVFMCNFKHAGFVFSVNYVILCFWVSNEHPQSKFPYSYEDNKVWK